MLKWEIPGWEITRFTYSKTLKALVLNFRTAHRSATRMYSSESGNDSGIGRKRKLTLTLILLKIRLHTGINRADFVSWWMWFNSSPTTAQCHFLTNAFCYLLTYTICTRIRNRRLVAVCERSLTKQIVYLGWN